MELWQSVRDELEVYEMDTEKLKKDGIIFYGGTRKPSGRDDFIKVYESQRLDGISKRYFGARRYYKQAIYYRMPRPIRAILKKMM